MINAASSRTSRETKRDIVSKKQKIETKQQTNKKTTFSPQCKLPLPYPPPLLFCIGTTLNQNRQDTDTYHFLTIVGRIRHLSKSF